MSHYPALSRRFLDLARDELATAQELSFSKIEYILTRLHRV